MDATLPDALDLMFGHEGGYSNRRTDAGGPTKYGVTAKTLGAARGLGRAASASEVQNLSKKEAVEIYSRSYWRQSGGSLLPIGIDYMAFDFGVNSGPGTAVKKLQEVVGVPADGIVGAQTISACLRYSGGLEKLAQDYADRRMKYLRGIGGKTGWSSNGRGWTIRVTGKDPKGQWKAQPGVIGNALAMIQHRKFVVVEESAGSAKANPNNTSVTEILKKPEAWAPLGGLLSAVGGLAAGSGPVQWALAAAMVGGVGVGLYYLVQRVRNDG